MFVTENKANPLGSPDGKDQHENNKKIRNRKKWQEKTESQYSHKTYIDDGGVCGSNGCACKL